MTAPIRAMPPASAPITPRPAIIRLRGPDPLSAAHRRRLLSQLNDAARRGDVEAAAALVRLSLAEEERRRAAALPSAGQGRLTVVSRPPTGRAFAPPVSHPPAASRQRSEGREVPGTGPGESQPEPDAPAQAPEPAEAPPRTAAGGTA